MAAEIPIAVRRFIARYLDSVLLLDVLLLLRAAPDKAWSIDEVARALVTSHEAAKTPLSALRSGGLASESDDGYRYDPGDWADVIDELAESYARRRHTVIGLIYGADTRPANALADAFRLRRRRD